MSGIDNPADIGIRAVNVHELKRSEWLTAPAWLKQPENEWPEQVLLTFASDKHKDQMVFSAKVEVRKPMIQLEQFSKLNQLVDTMAYVQHVFKKHKPATKTLSVEEREGAQASIFRPLQQEQFAEEIKSLKAEKEISKNSKTLQFSPFIDQQVLIRAQETIGKSELNFGTKNVGVDYFGSITLKIGRRNEKRWCCLFTCLTVRAVHVEIYQN